ncbi:Rha family transcriptional regulator [Listeria booriae]|uniref:Rha family transcriptional regulator n=1 Tax=Listeria booriae TaxID=1552123 RepID=UPI001629072B|nr:Rha family transcriptional regulator [Listeria booriae]MBC2149531.1 hypothetical protein [Listeria booriae]
MDQLERTISSVEVAKQVGKRHADLMRDIRKYCEYLGELNFEPGDLAGSKVAPGDFFIEATYLDLNNQERPSFNCTKQGCEMIANKMIGKKGVQFTAFYVQRFNHLEQQLKTPMTNEALIILQAQSVQELKKEVSGYAKRIEMLEKEVSKFSTKDEPLTTAQKIQLHNQVKANVTKFLGKASKDRSIVFKAYHEIWEALRTRYEVSTYAAIQSINFEEAMEYADLWSPSTPLAYEIKNFRS